MIWNNTFPTLSEGVHTVHVEVWDNANNHVSTSLTFRVDTMAPALTLTAPLANAFTTANSMTVTWTPSDANSGLQGCPYRIDGGSWSEVAFGVVSHTFTLLPDAHHTVEVRCYDNANNIQTRSVSFTSDTVDPTLSIDSPANLYLTNATSVTVTWSGSDSTAGIQGYQYQIDNGGYSGITSELSQMFSGLSNGAHEIDIKAIDNATRYTVSSINITSTTSPLC